ncbi:MAG: metallophosphoesterase [Acidobacteria bacterium]|nr:MAG: metallophosphoesterase [Acidobacteriota bacterium]
MRVAALYDIHGNLPALEAVLGDLRRAEVEVIVIGGDVVPGPMPSETLDRLLDVARDTRVQFIQGNGETAALAEISGTGADAVPEQYRGIVRWVAEQLTPAQQRLLASCPKTLRLRVEGLGDVLFCHATPRSDTEIFTRTTSEDRLLLLFAEANASTVVCGHTHMQFDRMVGGIRVINAGSVGMPYGEPGADWLLLGPGIELRHTPYDLAKAAERIQRTNYPQAKEFAEHYVLRPPSEVEMLDALRRAELK